MPTPDQAAEATELPSGPVAQGSGPTLWHNRDYLLLMSGKTTQIIGAGLAAFAVPLIAYDLTKSVFLAGLVSAIGAVGALVAALPAGAIADRVNRRSLLLWCSAFGMLLWGSLVIAALLGTLNVWHLAAVLFLSAIVGAFFAPAESAGIREVVRSDQLGSAMAAMQGRSAVAGLASGPIGGILYGISHAWPLVADVIGYAVAGLCTLFVRAPLNGDLSHAKRLSATHLLKDGLRFVWATTFLRTSIVIFSGINLAFGGIMFSLNLHLVQIGTAPFLIGLIDAVAGFSMLIGAVFAGPLVKRFRSGHLAIACMVLLVGGAIGLAASIEYVEYLVSIAVAALGIPALNSALLGYASAITPSKLQGRMNSVLSLCGVAVAPISPVLAGLFLGTMSVNASMGIFAALLLVAAVFFVLHKPIRTIGLPGTWADDLIEWPDPDAAVVARPDTA
jgi:MFS family permease